MAIHDIVLGSIGEGTTGGPSFKTRIERTDGGMEVRGSQWADTVSRVSYSLQTPPLKAAEMGAIRDFYRAMRGPAHAFRFLDAADWSTHPAHNQVPNLVNPAHRAPLLGVTGQSYFQMTKRYTDSAGVAITRVITRPIAAHHDPARHFLGVFVNGVPLYASIAAVPYVSVPGVKVAVEFATGRVYISPAPPVGTVVEWCGTFHVPAILHPETDGGIDMVWEEADVWRPNALRVAGLGVDWSEGPESVFYGGSGKVHTVPGGTLIALSTDDGVFQRVESSGSGTAFVQMPDLSLGTISFDGSGGPWLRLWLIANTTITVVDHTGFQLATVAAGQARTVELAWAGGNNSGGFPTSWHMR